MDQRGSFFVSFPFWLPSLSLRSIYTAFPPSSAPPATLKLTWICCSSALSAFCLTGDGCTRRGEWPGRCGQSAGGRRTPVPRGGRTPPRRVLGLWRSPPPGSRERGAAPVPAPRRRGGDLQHPSSPRCPSADVTERCLSPTAAPGSGQHPALGSFSWQWF